MVDLLKGHGTAATDGKLVERPLPSGQPRLARRRLLPLLVCCGNLHVLPVCPLVLLADLHPRAFLLRSGRGLCPRHHVAHAAAGGLEHQLLQFRIAVTVPTLLPDLIQTSEHHLPRLPAPPDRLNLDRSRAGGRQLAQIPTDCRGPDPAVVGVPERRRGLRDRHLHDPPVAPQPDRRVLQRPAVRTHRRQHHLGVVPERGVGVLQCFAAGLHCLEHHVAVAPEGLRQVPEAHRVLAHRCQSNILVGEQRFVNVLQRPAISLHSAECDRLGCAHAVPGELDRLAKLADGSKDHRWVVAHVF